MTYKPVCCVCGEPATLLDTEYDEAWCDTHAREYKVMEGPYHSLKEAEYVVGKSYPATDVPGAGAHLTHGGLRCGGLHRTFLSFRCNGCDDTFFVPRSGDEPQEAE